MTVNYPKSSCREISASFHACVFPGLPCADLKRFAFVFLTAGAQRREEFKPGWEAKEPSSACQPLEVWAAWVCAAGTSPIWGPCAAAALGKWWLWPWAGGPWPQAGGPGPGSVATGAPQQVGQPGAALQGPLSSREFKSPLHVFVSTLSSVPFLPLFSYVSPLRI